MSSNVVNEATQNSNKRVQRRREKREIEELNFLTEILTTKKAVRSNDSFTKTNYIRIRNVFLALLGAQ